MKKLPIVLSTLILAISISCSETDISKKNQIKVDDKGIETLVKFIDFNVAQLTASGFNAYGDQVALTKFIEDNSQAFEKKFGISLYKTTSYTRAETSQYTTTKDAEVAEKLTSITVKSIDENDYLVRLSNLKNQIYSYDISLTEQQILLNKITLLERLTRYMALKASLVHSVKKYNSNTSAKEECDGWWSCWGKCAAGTVGGALTGALTFGLGGAAVGTVALPVIGTVSAGAVGAIGGAIAGGLTGAAASCD